MRILIAADLSINQVDGSTIWTKNLVSLLAKMDDAAEVFYLAREHPNTKSPIVNDMAKIDRVTIIDPQPFLPKFSDRMDATNIASVVESVENKYQFDLIICRGLNFIEPLARHERFSKKLTCYWTGIDKDILLYDIDRWDFLRKSELRFLSQTNYVKKFLEVFLEIFSGNIAILPPMIDVSLFNFSEENSDSTDINICYSGKIDKDYLVLELLKIGGHEVTHGAKINVDILAGKLTKSKSDPDFLNNWRSSLEKTDKAFVTVHENVKHSEIVSYMQGADLGWCLRSEKYDSSAEISTKMLEYAALGIPPILNPTPINISVFGGSYPLYAKNTDEALDLIREHSKLPNEKREELRKLCREVALRYDISCSVAPLKRLLWPPTCKAVPISERPLSVQIASHDTKFLDRALGKLEATPGLSFSYDRWKSTKTPQVDRLAYNSAHDVVICEWCCENAVWFSYNKRPNSKLIIRLHRFEVFRDFPSRVNWSNVDRLIVVSDYFRDLCIQKFGVPADIISVFPQFIDTVELDRVKHPRSYKTIGMVGINPFNHKRFDRAIDFFREVHKLDNSIMFRVRSVMPWEFDWIWNGANDERRKYEQLFRELSENPDLASRIIFDRPGRDMEEWYREVSVVLSSSDSEGCHTSILEGMASGCIPIVFNWPGAKSLFPNEYVYDDLMEGAKDAVHILSSGQAESLGENMKKWVARYDRDEFISFLLKQIYYNEKAI